MKNTCPVCGYNKLTFKPYDENGYASFQICPCCGFEFGYDDFPDKENAFIEWRENWINGGCNWFSRNPKPQNWNAKEQLKKLNGDNL